MRLDAVHAPVHLTQSACDADDPRCFSEVAIKLLETAAGGYDFRLTVDDRTPLQFHIQKDPIAVFRDAASRTLQVAAFLPALLSLLVAFKRELWQGLRNLAGLKPARGAAEQERH